MKNKFLHLYLLIEGREYVFTVHNGILFNAAYMINIQATKIIIIFV